MVSSSPQTTIPPLPLPYYPCRLPCLHPSFSLHSIISDFLPSQPRTPTIPCSGTLGLGTSLTSGRLDVARVRIRPRSAQSLVPPLVEAEAEHDVRNTRCHIPSEFSFSLAFYLLFSLRSSDIILKILSAAFGFYGGETDVACCNFEVENMLNVQVDNSHACSPTVIANESRSESEDE